MDRETLEQLFSWAVTYRYEFHEREYIYMAYAHERGVSWEDLKAAHEIMLGEFGLLPLIMYHKHGLGAAMKALGLNIDE